MTQDFDIGSMHEGIIEMDPLTGRMVLRCEDAKGKFVFVDVQERLGRYKGSEVRLIITPLSTVATLAAMVDAGEMDLQQVPRLTKT